MPFWHKTYLKQDLCGSTRAMRQARYPEKAIQLSGKFPEKTQILQSQFPSPILRFLSRNLQQAL